MNGSQKVQDKYILSELMCGVIGIILCANRNEPDEQSGFTGIFLSEKKGRGKYRPVLMRVAEIREKQTARNMPGRL